MNAFSGSALFCKKPRTRENIGKHLNHYATFDATSVSVSSDPFKAKTRYGGNIDKSLFHDRHLPLKMYYEVFEQKSENKRQE